MSTGGRVIKNTAILSIGQIVTLALGMVFTALLSRHIGPEGYGQYAFAQSTVAVLLILVNLGFGNLTIRDLAQRKEQASKYFVNIVFMKSLLAVVVFSIYLTVNWFNGSSKEFPSLIFLVGVNMSLGSLTQTAGNVFFAFEKMEYDVLAQIVRAVLALGLGAWMISLGYPLIQIVAVVICANIVKLFLSFGLLSRIITRVKLEVDLGFSKRLAVASVPFALLVIVNVIFSNVGVIMLGNFSNDTVVGWYASAARIQDLLLIVPSMFWISIYPVFSKFYVSSRVSLAKSYRKSYQWGLILGLPMAAGILLVADQVISMVFGPGFENASIVLRVLSFVIAVSFCNNVNGSTINAMGRERLFAVLSTVTVVLVVVLNWVFIPKYSYVVVAVTQNVAVGLGFIVYSLLCHRWLGLSLPWKTAMKTAIATLIMAILVFYALQRGVNLPTVVLIIGPGVYGAVVYVLRVLSSEDVLSLKRAFRLA